MPGMGGGLMGNGARKPRRPWEFRAWGGFNTRLCYWFVGGCRVTAIRRRSRESMVCRDIEGQGSVVPEGHSSKMGVKECVKGSRGSYERRGGGKKKTRGGF